MWTTLASVCSPPLSTIIVCGTYEARVTEFFEATIGGRPVVGVRFRILRGDLSDKEVVGFVPRSQEGIASTSHFMRWAYHNRGRLECEVDEDDEDSTAFTCVVWVYACAAADDEDGVYRVVEVAQPHLGLEPTGVRNSVEVREAPFLR